MKFAFNPEVESFRQEVRDFIAKELPAEGDRPEHGTPGFSDQERAYTLGFQKKLSEKGWLAMAWPKEYGGGGADHMRQLVYNEEMAYANAPHFSMGIAWVGPSIMLFGTDEQKKEFIPRIAEAEDWWCTLYSEPGSGSDLASLQTRAVRDGDDFIINGQKIWTSGGHMADWGWLAARTDPEAPKHKGISLFLLDMKTPGVTVRPLVNMALQHSFNEVFFEDVRIPASRMVGEENRGWYHLAVALDFERSSVGAGASARKTLDRLVAVAHERPELVELRPGIRHELADRAVESNVAQMLSYRVATMQAKGLVPNHEASASKLFGADLAQRVSNTAMHLLGMSGQLRLASHRQIMDEATEYLSNVSASIAGGTNEVQRSILATRGLGLPRG
ncbi:MAG: acyl-CoA dehydrogenase family protein [Tepidiformaceae bacterium]